jgi:hypothetical protein
MCAMSDDPGGRAKAAIPAWLRVETPYAGYADAVVADLTRLAATPSGRALLEQIRASGKSILIGRPAVLDPPSAAVQAIGADGGCRLCYEPRQWPNPIHPTSRTSDAMLFVLLRHTLALLRGAEEPAPDPAAAEAEVARYLSERDDG